MKWLMVLLFGCPFMLSAQPVARNPQQETEQPTEQTIDPFCCIDPHSYPEFPGNMIQYIMEHFQIPADAPEAEGRIILRCIIDEAGCVTDIKVLRGIEPRYDREAMRVLSSMPCWKPATTNGKK